MLSHQKYPRMEDTKVVATSTVQSKVSIDCRKYQQKGFRMVYTNSLSYKWVNRATNTMIEQICCVTGIVSKTKPL